MDLATILNPSTNNKQHDHQHVYIDSSFHRQSHAVLQSPPLSPKQQHHELLTSTMINNMKPRSRFSALEDDIICQGVANGLTWGQISGQLPHRKRATCFNRYRTLQGIRKSRPQSAMLSPPSKYASVKYNHHHHHHHHQYPYYRRHSVANHQYYHHSQAPTTPWLPSSPPLTAPGLIMDHASSPSMDPTRRMSTCSSLSSASPLPSPSILQHDLYHSSRRASNSSTSSSSFYHYHRF